MVLSISKSKFFDPNRRIIDPEMQKIRDEAKRKEEEEKLAAIKIQSDSACNLMEISSNIENYDQTEPLKEFEIYRDTIIKNKKTRYPSAEEKELIIAKFIKLFPEKINIRVMTQHLKFSSYNEKELSKSLIMSIANKYKIDINFLSISNKKPKNEVRQKSKNEGYAEEHDQARAGVEFKEIIEDTKVSFRKEIDLLKKQIPIEDLKTYSVAYLARKYKTFRYRITLVKQELNIKKISPIDNEGLNKDKEKRIVDFLKTNESKEICVYEIVTGLKIHSIWGKPITVKTLKELSTKNGINSKFRSEIMVENLKQHGIQKFEKGCTCNICKLSFNLREAISNEKHKLNRYITGIKKLMYITNFCNAVANKYINEYLENSNKFYELVEEYILKLFKQKKISWLD